MDENAKKIENFEQLLKEKTIKKPLSIYKDRNPPKIQDSTSNCASLASEFISCVAASLKAIQSSETVKLNKNVRKNLDKYKRHGLLPLTQLDIEFQNMEHGKPSTSKFETQNVTDTQLIDVINQAEALVSVGTQNQMVNEFESSFTNNNIPNDDSTIYFDTSIEVEDNSKEDESRRCVDMAVIRKTADNITLPINENIENDIKTQREDDETDTSAVKDVNDIELPTNVEITNSEDAYSKYKEQENQEDNNYSQPPSPILSIGTKSTISTHLVYDLDLFEDFEKVMATGITNDDSLVQSQILGTVDQTTRHTHEGDNNDIIPFQASPILHSTTASISVDKSDIQAKSKIDKNANDINEEQKLRTSTPDISDEMLKDEILFSSDEEGDYIHRDIQELPFTCALETSFYTNQSDVLDKTVYIDYHRDTNSDSYVQANDYFDAIKLSVSELVEMREKDRDNGRLIGEKEIATGNAIDVEDEKADITIDNIIANDEESLNTKKKVMVGFTTASNKPIEFSAKCNEKIRQVFEDIDLGDVLEGAPKINKQTHNDEFNDSKMDIDFNEINRLEGINEIEISPVLKFNGFTTASNKNIKISDSALLRTRKVFQDIDLDEKLELEFQDEFSNQVKDTGKSKLKSKEAVGFMTASKKKINVSEKSMTATKKIFEDIEDIPDYNKPSTSKEFKGSDYINEELSPPRFLGFQTASNKKVNISRKALEHSRKIFQDIDLTNQKYVNNSAPLKLGTESESDVILEETAETSNKAIECNSHEKEIPVFQGFQTASMKPVTISENAIAKTKDIFKDIDLLTNGMPDKNTRPEEKAEFKGFQTASKKPVCISKVAIEKTKDIFKDIESFKEDDGALKGFQTASKKPVSISKDAIAKTKDIFKDISLEDPFFVSNEHSTKEKSVERIYVEDTTTNNIQTHEISAEPSYRKVSKILEDEDFSSKLGLQTASKKKVQISKTALDRTKRIFQNFEENFNIQKENDEKSCKIGFKTANNNDIKISEEAILKSKLLLADNEQSKAFKSPNQSKTKTVDQSEGIDELINTQVLRNFNEDLNTEDFIVTPKKQNIRSGSPILSCPKAKRRKIFVTPYKVNEVKSIQEEVKPNLSNKMKYNFEGSYKKVKLINLTDVANLEKESKSVSHQHTELERYDFENVIHYVFEGSRNNLSEVKASMNDIKLLFLDSLNSRIVPDGWFENHFKQIVWKLIRYEITYPNTMANVLNTKNVMEQLKYRYDKELYRVERPALRKIMEKDELPTRTMVLSVASILVDGSLVESVTDLNSNIELTLTDGWYSVRTTIDKMLSKLVYDNKIVVGTKLITNGAELINCDQGISPWEDTTNVRLKISGNSTRRARPETKLGFHGNAAILVPLTSVKLNGGKVSKLRLLVTRVYPMLYVEKFEDGSTVTRSEKLEQIHQMRYETERQIMMEKIYEEVEREFEQLSQYSNDAACGVKRKLSMESGSQIAKAMRRSRDPIQFRAQLTTTQASKLEQFTSKQRDRMLQEMQARVGNVVRDVATLCKLRVVDVSGHQVVCAMMSIWRPNDAILEILKEGEFIDVRNVFPTSMRNAEIQLTAGRQSVFSRTKAKYADKTKQKTLQRQCYDIKDLVKNPIIKTDFNEIDAIGIVVEIDPPMNEFESSKHNFQNVYLSDEHKNLICLNFWDGIKKFGFQNLLDTGQIVYATNLQKRVGNTRKYVPHYRVTELSWFTKTPRNNTVRTKIEALQTIWNNIDKKAFIQECIESKNKANNSKYANENVSPYRPNVSDYSMSKNRVYIESPLTKADLSLTGLDFESTFKQTETQGMSPELLARKKRLNEKLAKLKMYGEPPPLSPIHIINKSKSATCEYKSPLAVKRNEQTEGSLRKVSKKPEKSDCNVKTSEVLFKNGEGSSKNEVGILLKSDGSCKNDLNRLESDLNRTYVKRSYVNPVKLNFSGLNESVIDQFGEDFDASPPLSLE